MIWDFEKLKNLLKTTQNFKRYEINRLNLEEEIKGNIILFSLIRFFLNKFKKDGYLIEVNLELNKKFFTANVEDAPFKYEKIFENNIENKNCREVIDFIVNELIINVKEHSHTNDIFGGIDKNSSIFISIFDDGIGIHNRFKEFGYVFENDNEAIKKALEGFSVKGVEERGYGLRYLRVFATHSQSEVYIFSQNGFVIIKNEKIEPNELDFYFPGTGVIIKIDDENLSGLKLDDLVRLVK